MSKHFNEVRAETLEAYIDAHCSDADLMQKWEEIRNRRNLNFKASHTVSCKDAFKIMKEALTSPSGGEGGYNAFNPELLKKLPDDCRVILAREGSVCIYVKGKVKGKKIPTAKSLKCDEYDEVDSLIRIWWD